MPLTQAQTYKIMEVVVYLLFLRQLSQFCCTFWCLCWLMFRLAFLHSLQVVSVGRRKFSADFQLAFRLIKGFIFLSFVALLISLIVVLHLKFRDIIVCILAFMPTGWGMLLVSANSFCLKYSSSLCVFDFSSCLLSDCSSFEAFYSTFWLLGIDQDTCPWLWNCNGVARVHTNCLLGLVSICFGVSNPYVVQPSIQ